MSSLFVKLDETNQSGQAGPYICTWDSASKVLQVTSCGQVYKKYKELDLEKALRKVAKLQRKLLNRKI